MSSDKEPAYPFLSARHASLPKWAQRQISNFRVEQIDREYSDYLNADIRKIAKDILGGNCTFSDDDLHLIAFLAVRAIDAGLIEDIGDKLTLSNIRDAAEKRKSKTVTTEDGRCEIPIGDKVFTRAGEIVKERYPAGCTDAAILADVVREVQKELGLR